MRCVWRSVLRGVGCAAGGILVATAPVSADAPTGQPPAGAAKAGATTEAQLSTYFDAFAKKRLLSVATAEVSELRAQLAEAERLAQDGRDEDAVLLLFDVTQHPRFAAYTDLEELSAAYYALGSSLHTLGAEPSARVALRKVLDKGPTDRYFAPAWRRYVDVALATGPSAASLLELEKYGAQLKDDAADELAYLRARVRQDAGDFESAKLRFDQVSRRSRFYVNAQYELGAIAAKERAYRTAEERFCRIARSSDDRHFAFYVDGRYFRVKDLARLGLGRVAHEQGRGDDAFNYYFQVPNDSPRVAEALFEAAYARYEAGDADGAADLLDQLDARYPHSTFADEAAVLRGYVALSRCDFEAANRYFTRFNTEFSPLLAHIDRLLQNPERRAALYETLNVTSGAPSSQPQSTVQRNLLTLLRVQPEFAALHDEVAQLDREAARSGTMSESFALLSARFDGTERPRAAATQLDPVSIERLRQQLSDARRGLRALTEQLDAMRALGAKSAELAAQEKTLAELALHQRKLETALTALSRTAAERAAGASERSDAREVSRLLSDDVVRAHGFEARFLALRPALVQAANERALIELKALRERLAGFLRRGRIGRIDAVMGSKRRVEQQIEQLSNGQLPLELQDPLRVQGFLGDDEEYWPFEGEDWPDEYLENMPTASPAKPQGAAR